MNNRSQVVVGVQLLRAANRGPAVVQGFRGSATGRGQPERVRAAFQRRDGLPDGREPYGLRDAPDAAGPVVVGRRGERRGKSAGAGVQDPEENAERHRLRDGRENRGRQEEPAGRGALTRGTETAARNHRVLPLGTGIVNAPASR